MITETPKVWDADSTYTINQLISNKIKPQQVTNLLKFDAIDMPNNSKRETQTILPDEFDNLYIDGTYNRAIEDYNYRKLFENLQRRNGFSYPSASGINIFRRPDGKLYIVDGVHRASFSAVKDIPIHANIHIHNKNSTDADCRKKEAQVYTDLGYHTYSQSPDQMLKAAYVAGEQWAIDFVNVLQELNLYVKGLGDPSGTKLNGYKTFLDTITNSNGTIDIQMREYASEAAEMLHEELKNRTSVKSLFISGLTLLYSKKEYLPIFVEEEIKFAIKQAIGSDKFLERTIHGKPRENLALRFAHLYNNSGKGKKKFTALSLETLCDKFEVETSILKSDSLMANI
tara:strand:- start:54 stop:1079 length:1026 start_codon:yes stop_codon:yes gene_type:complete